VRQFLRSTSAATTILIRLLVGGVFLSEGIQKFLFPEVLAVGRFTEPPPARIASRETSSSRFELHALWSGDRTWGMNLASNRTRGVESRFKWSTC